MKKIAILASGSGSNAEKIILHFRNRTDVAVEMVLANRPDAGVLERARRLEIPVRIFDREEFRREDGVLRTLEEAKIDYLILAGFLWLVPPPIIRRFEGRIYNIHPALLPAFGGKGFYGMKVHQAMID